MVIDTSSSSSLITAKSNRKMKKNNKNALASNNEASSPLTATQPVAIANLLETTTTVPHGSGKNKKKQNNANVVNDSAKGNLASKTAVMQKQNSNENEDEENERNSSGSSSSSGSMEAVCVNNTMNTNSGGNDVSGKNNIRRGSQKSESGGGGSGHGVVGVGGERNKFQEINLNLLSDLSDESNSSSSSSSSSLSSPPPPLASIQLQQQQQQQQYLMGANTVQPNPASFFQGQQLVQQVHPIQSVQPFKNSTTPLGTLSNNIQASKQVLSNSIKKDGVNKIGNSYGVGGVGGGLDMKQQMLLGIKDVFQE